MQTIEARIAHHEQDIEVVRRREQPARHDHLGEQDADREQIRARIDVAIGDLLGRHVAVLALERAGFGLVAALGGARDAEVGELDVAAPRQQHVARRDIAVNDAELAAVHVGRRVRVVERVEHVARDQRCEIRRQPDLRARTLAKQPEHVEAIDVLHRDVRRVGVGAELEHLHDVAMIELRRDACLVDEHLDEGLVGREVREDLLDRDQLLEPEVADQLRLEQLGHTANRQAIEDGVPPDLLWGGAGHWESFTIQPAEVPVWQASVQTARLSDANRPPPRCNSARLHRGTSLDEGLVEVRDDETHALHTLVSGIVRRTWLVAVVASIVCAGFAASAVAALVEASYLAPNPARAPLTPRVQVAAPARTPPDGRTLVARNMFCSTCAPDVNVDPGPTDSFVPNAILIATALGDDPSATVRVPGSEAQGSFGVGDQIPGVGKVDKIDWVSIDVLDTSGRRGRLKLLDPAAASHGDAGAATPDPAAAAAPEPWAGRIKKIDDHTFEVDRELVREMVSGTVKPGGARIVPVTDKGELKGLRMFGVATTSLAGELGLKNGDMLSSINNKQIQSAQSLLDVYANMDQLSTVELDGTRAGKPLQLTLRLR